MPVPGVGTVGRERDSFGRGGAGAGGMCDPLLDRGWALGAVGWLWC